MAVSRRVLVVTVAVVVSLMILEARPMVENRSEKQASTLQTPNEVPAAFRDLGRFVNELMSYTDDTNHSDADGLPDSVEVVIGTDPFNSDSDFDRLNDYYEALNGMDPNKPDSNNDRFPDYHEVTDVPLDVDGDGVPNAWDLDNDDDGVADYADLSPFAKTTLESSFQVDISTSGNPTYVSVELRTKNPDHMRLIQQTWNWPSDSKGSFMDLDNSVDDVYVVPSLRIDCANLPSQTDVIDYGIIVDDGAASALVPLAPVWDYGNTVALKGRMFFPSTPAPLSASLHVSLMWSVMGMNDDWAVAFAVPGGKYLSVLQNGSVRATGDSIEANETFAWKSLENDRFALRAANGLYLTLGSDGYVTASSRSIASESVFTLMTDSTGKCAIFASDGSLLHAYTSEYLMSGYGMPFTKVDLGVASFPTSLATYYEDFTLAGLNVAENHGTDIGVFKGTNHEELMAANQLLADSFLRDSSCGMNDIDIPKLLDGHDLTGITFDIQSYSHQDLALQAAVSSMVPAAVASISPKTTLPIIVGMQDSSAVVDLSELSDEYIIDGTLSFDTRNEPVVVSKLLRSGWYEGGSNTPLELYQVIDEVRKWGLDDNAFETAVGLIAIWYSGECCEVSVGGIPVDFSFPEAEVALRYASDIVDYAMTAIDTVLAGIKMVTWSGATAGTWQSIDKAMAIVSIVLDVGIAGYSIYVIGEELGWGAIGTGIAITYSIVKLCYSLLLTVLYEYGGIAGSIIATALILIDYLLQWIWDIDWLDLFIGWLCDILSDIRKRSTVDAEYLGSNMGIDDADKNGIDVGDSIGYSSRWYGKVSLTKDGHWNDLDESYIVPHQKLSAPLGSTLARGGATIEGASTYTSDGESKRTYYETYAWVSPGTPMVNFPLTAGMYADWRVFYEECWWYPFVGWECDRKSATNDPWDTPTYWWTRMHVDVMPGSIDGFCDWRGIASNDPDGDGLNRSEEGKSGTNPWVWDTDGDGLIDSYEVTIGTNPIRSDSDGDLLNDMFEHQRGFNCTRADTDSDSLDDFFEYRGWAVDLAYRGRTYYWMVSSDPCLRNTDGDGLSDGAEYYSLLNPRSRDTDGDGNPDEGEDYYITHIDYVLSLVSKMYPGLIFYHMAVDDNGLVYCWANSPPVSRSEYLLESGVSGWGIIIFDPSLGEEIGGFTTVNSTAEMDCVTLGGRETLIFTSYTPSPSSNFSSIIEIYSKDGTWLNKIDLGGICPSMGVSWCYGIALTPPGVFGDYRMIVLDSRDHVHKVHMRGVEMIGVDATWGGHGTGPGEFNGTSSIAFDPANGDIFVCDSGNHRIQRFDYDGAYVTEWGNEELFGTLMDVAVDADGNILTMDATEAGRRIQKWSPGGRSLYTMSTSGVGLDVDRENYIYVCENWYSNPPRNDNISIFEQTLELIHPVPDYTFVDADGDGLTDIQETLGWDITVSGASGASDRASVASVKHVTSDPLAPDTDFDGVNDADEAFLWDPRSIDSDDDGLSDSEELEIGTSPTSWDTDDEGLGDGVEVGFGSDPENQDSDSEGVSDYQEFTIDSDPNSNDTDQDGLNDLYEVGYGADPKNPDPDGDFMFDGQEFELGADPNSKDTDSDGIEDGFEVLYGTSVTSGDSDGDGLSDGFEISSLMSPLSKDTDHDGIDDMKELELGLNPKSGDSDGDGVPDSLDLDYQLELDGEIVMSYDANSTGAEGLALDLSNQASVRVVGPDKLLQSYKGSRYVVLVGDPEGANGTAGGVIGDLLKDSGDVRQRMKESEYDRIAVRYGAWNDTQTIVMLSSVYETDWMRVIGMLKSMQMTLSDRSVLVEYKNPRACFLLDQEDVIKTTDTYVWTKLDNMTTFKVSVEKLTDGEMTTGLSDSDALSSGEMIMNKYVRIDFQPTGSGATATVLGTLIQIYYTVADLDLNGDGDTDDPEDLNESSLNLFVMSDHGSWVRLTDITNTTGVNTTDVVLFGKQYAGYIWANMSSLSLFGIAGSTNGEPSGPGTSWLLVALLALSAIALIAAAITILMIRRKRQPPASETPKSQEGLTDV